MAQITVTLTETEELAMSTVAISADAWIQNASHERARIAIEDIVKNTVQKCLEDNLQIPNTKEEMVSLAMTNGWVRTTIQQIEEADALDAGRLAKQTAE